MQSEFCPKGKTIQPKRGGVRESITAGTELNVLQLGLIHAEVMPQFVEHGLPDLVTDFGFAGADRLDILLVENDAVRSRTEVKRKRLTNTPVRMAGSVLKCVRMTAKQSCQRASDVHERRFGSCCSRHGCKRAVTPDAEG